MFLRSKIQEMILRRRSRSLNSTGGAQRGHVTDQVSSSSAAPCDGDGAVAGSGGGKSATVGGMFAAPRLLHSSSLPAGAGTVFAKSPAPDAEPEAAAAAFSMSPTSVLDAAAAFVSGPDGGAGKRRRPWRARDNNGLADALDCGDQHLQQQKERLVLAATSASLVRSYSLDRRVEFGVKNKSSWLPLRASSGSENASPAAPADPGEMEMEPSSEDYTCVISRGPNPRTVHIFGDRVVEAEAAANGAERAPRPITQPARGDRGFLSL